MSGPCLAISEAKKQSSRLRGPKFHAPKFSATVPRAFTRKINLPQKVILGISGAITTVETPLLASLRSFSVIERHVLVPYLIRRHYGCRLCTPPGCHPPALAGF